MKPASAKAKGRICRRCKGVFSYSRSHAICSSCRERCVSCSESLTEESKSISAAKRQQYLCRKCAAASAKESRGNKGFNQKEYDLKRNYGLTLEEYQKMLYESGGMCKICKQTRPLVVDHCHETGVIRGLLCNPCNKGIGHLGDSVENLVAAAEYLNGQRN